MKNCISSTVRWLAGWLMVGLLLPAAAGAQAPATSSVGCDLSRPAVAYASGQLVTAPQKLVPCATETGFYTGETGIAVTREGTVWFSAANWEWALARSADQGAHWQAFTVPGPQAYPGCNVASSAYTCNTSEQSKTNTVADAFLYVDPRTDKLFWSKTYGEAVCSSLSMSPDDGASWQPVPQFACPGGDYEKISAGPPPPGGARPSGYPDVVYTCVVGPAPTFAVGPDRICYKSLDGGSTWSATGAPVTPSPLAPGCPHYQEPQRVGPDGTLYVPLNCSLGGANSAAPVQVALSHDEGTTWSYVPVPVAAAGTSLSVIGGVSLDVDASGSIYVVWPGADHRVYLSVSKDHGKTWNGPMVASPPGVKQPGAPFAQVTAQGPGHVAIAYYGYTGSDSKRLNGYLTESFDATQKSPLLYTAELNDPAHPLYFPVKSGNLPRNDYLGVTFAPDGTPWTGLVKLLSDTPDSQGFIQSSGFAGRLVPASSLTPRSARPLGRHHRRPARRPRKHGKAHRPRAVAYGFAGRA